jgi:hypothetical protein
MSEYPEHDRMAAVKAESQTVGQFLEWMDTVGWHVAQWVCGGHYDERQRHETKPETEYRDSVLWYHKNIPAQAGDGLADECENPTLMYVGIGIEKMLARYFDIDLAKVSAEKDQMLARLRAEATP